MNKKKKNKFSHNTFPFKTRKNTDIILARFVINTTTNCSMWHIYFLKRCNYKRRYLDFETRRDEMRFPWETDRLSRSEFEYRSRNQRVSEGLGDKMLTRVFSPTCWSQAERDEVTRCNLRQPSLTRTRLEGTNSPAADFAFLCFTLLCFTRTAAASALEGSVFYTRQDAP